MNTPNIIFILTDDMGAWAMGCAGNPEIQTPNLDRLAASGMRFENFFCTSPVCSPARASILTGRLPSFHGVHDFLMCGQHLLKDVRGYTDRLAENGYVCGHSGKWHMGDMSFPQKGYTFWRPRGGSYTRSDLFNEQGEAFTVEGYSTDIITDHALEFMDARKNSDEPFYLNVCFQAPHSPWEREHHPAELWDRYFNECPFASVPCESKHPWDARMTVFFDHPMRRRIQLSGYFAAITAMDAAVGCLLDRLDALGMRENTLVFFCSDNGMNMGHHGICGKGNGTKPLNMYDTSVKVPAIANWPGVIPAGVVTQSMQSQYDLMPTFLECAGIDNPLAGEQPGRSFAELLRTGKDDGREHVVVFDEYGPTRMIRTPDWKYIHRYPEGPNELYDLVNDPGEETNLVDDPSQAERIDKMRAELIDWFEQYVDPKYDGSKLPVTGSGQLDFADRPNAFEPDWRPDWYAHSDKLKKEIFEQYPEKKDYVFPK